MFNKQRLLYGLFALLIITLSIVIELYLEKQLQNWLKQRLIIELSQKAALIKNTLRITNTSFIDSSFDPFIDNLTHNTPYRITIIDKDGFVIADSELSGTQLLSVENHKDRPEFLTATDRIPGIQTRHSKTLNEDMLYFATPYLIHNNEGFLRIALSLSEMQGYMSNLRSILYTTSLLAFAILSSLIFFAFKLIQRSNSNHRDDLIKVQKFSNLLSSCQDTDAFINVVASTAASIYPNTSGAISIVQPETDQYEIITSWGNNWTGQQYFSESDCWAFHEGLPHISESKGLELKCKHLESTYITICIPLLGQNTTLGALHLVLEKELSIDEQEELISKADHLSLALSNINLRETLKTQAIRDPLTNLYNRRFLDESFASEVLRAKRQQYSIGIMMIDIDHFKKFNDTFGHNAGDYVLELTAAIIERAVRGDDLACRYGGEEFVLVMPNAPLDIVINRANSLLEEIRNTSYSFEGKSLGAVTISIGVALHPDHGEGETIISIADKALYQAKENGRDQLKIATNI